MRESATACSCHEQDRESANWVVLLLRQETVACPQRGEFVLLQLRPLRFRRGNAKGDMGFG